MTQTGTQLGTPHYMSPEQIRGKKNISARSDIYSLGVMAYELFTGKRPFPGNDPVAIGYAHAYSEFPPAKRKGKKLSEDLENWLKKALEKKPSSRFRTASSMRNSLAKAAKALNIEVPKLIKGEVPEMLKHPSVTQETAPKRTNFKPPKNLRRKPTPSLGSSLSSHALNRILWTLLFVSLSLPFVPFSKNELFEEQYSEKLFLKGLGHAQKYEFSKAKLFWLKSGVKSPKNLPRIRKYSEAYLLTALKSKDCEAALNYLDVLDWADPSWPASIKHRQDLNRLKQSMDSCHTLEK